MKLTTKQIVTGGALLAIMILSQFLKNLSVYITGPIVNTVLIIATLSLGVGMGIILSIIAPITAFLITGSPIMAGIPLIMPAIMIGNIILCVATDFFYKKFKYKGKLATGMIVGSVLKALFMFAVIVKCLLPLLSENIKVPAEKLPGVLKVASTQFGLTQLITALIGSALAWVIWMTVGKNLKNGSKEN